MTRQETAKIMSVLKAAYPRYYANSDMSSALDLWTAMLDAYDYVTITCAVKAVIATSKYPPTVADILERVNMITQPEAMGENEAWSYVRKAISNSAYNSREEFEKLPEECKAVVYSPEQLKAWAMLPPDELNTVVASNFMRDFRGNESRRKERQMLPSSVKAMLSEQNKPQLAGAEQPDI